MKWITLPLLALALATPATAASRQNPAADRSPAVVDFSGGELLPGGTFNVLTYDAPADTRIGDTGLMEAGIAGAELFQRADEIRIFSSRAKSNASPMARLWVNTAEGQYWFHTGGKGSAQEFVIPKGAMVVLWTRASTEPVAWTSAFE